IVGAAEHLGLRGEPLHIEALLALGQLERAGEVLARLEARGRSLPRPWITVTLPRARALVAAGEGDLVSALGDMAGVDPNVARLLPFEHGQNLLVYGRLLRRAKQRRAAGEAFTNPLPVFPPPRAPTSLPASPL